MMRKKLKQVKVQQFTSLYQSIEIWPQQVSGLNFCFDNKSIITIISIMIVCVCVCVIREVTGSTSTSSQMLLLSLGDGDCRPQ